MIQTAVRLYTFLFKTNCTNTTYKKTIFLEEKTSKIHYPSEKESYQSNF